MAHDIVESRSGLTSAGATVVWWRNPAIRAIIAQLLVLGAVVALGYYLVSNLLVNLEDRRIRTGFGFLDQQAGFAIGESVIPFAPTDSYGRAFVAGLLNTLRVSLLGIVLATLLGIVMGISRLSTNWLVAKLASVYVEVTRNIPLLLQLFFWYTVITQLLPAVREALTLLPGVVLSKSGLQFPSVIYEPAQLPVYITFGHLGRRRLRLPQLDVQAAARDRPGADAAPADARHHAAAGARRVLHHGRAARARRADLPDVQLSRRLERHAGVPGAAARPQLLHRRLHRRDRQKRHSRACPGGRARPRPRSASGAACSCG